MKNSEIEARLHILEREMKKAQILLIHISRLVLDAAPKSEEPDAGNPEEKTEA